MQPRIRKVAVLGSGVMGSAIAAHFANAGIPSLVLDIVPPDLTDAVWLYGSDPATITRIVHDGPFGVMPAWSGRLSDAEINLLALYVARLGRPEGGGQ